MTPRLSNSQLDHLQQELEKIHYRTDRKFLNHSIDQKASLSAIRRISSSLLSILKELESND